MGARYERASEVCQTIGHERRDRRTPQELYVVATSTDCEQSQSLGFWPMTSGSAGLPSGLKRLPLLMKQNISGLFEFRSVAPRRTTRLMSVILTCFSNADGRTDTCADSRSPP